MNILIIDAQGGGIGRQLIAAIRENIQDAVITAVGRMWNFLCHVLLTHTRPCRF